MKIGNSEVEYAAEITSEINVDFAETPRSPRIDHSAPRHGDAEKDEFMQYKQWSVGSGGEYVPCGVVVPTLKPGIYEINQNPTFGVYFSRLAPKDDVLFEIDNSPVMEIVGEVQRFWELGSVFKDHNIQHKRGIILYGPPGTGKSSLIRLVTKDVIGRGGIVVTFKHPDVFVTGMRMMRSIQPSTPVVVIMEDIDAVLEHYSESCILNILDGVTGLDRVVFLATTNYVERLPERIVNRPSRFDKRYFIGPLDESCRKSYFEKVFKTVSDLGPHTPERWANDTEGLSISHLKELFIQVFVFQNDYEKSLEYLQGMKSKPKNKSQLTTGFMV